MRQRSVWPVNWKKKQDIVDEDQIIPNVLSFRYVNRTYRRSYYYSLIPCLKPGQETDSLFVLVLISERQFYNIYQRGAFL